MEQLNTFLKTGVVRVTFTKKDGSVRVMFCTKIPEVMAPLFSDAGAGAVSHVEKEGLLKVVDVDLNEFRSFNYDQVTNYSVDVVRLPGINAYYHHEPVAQNA